MSRCRMANGTFGRLFPHFTELIAVRWCLAHSEPIRTYVREIGPWRALWYFSAAIWGAGRAQGFEKSLGF
jgi:hypothetical protein